jgi:hypothetical protein
VQVWAWSPPDDTGRYGLSDAAIRNTQKGAKPDGLTDRFVLLLDLHTQLIILHLQFFVFVPNINEGEVSVPHTPQSSNSPLDQLLTRDHNVQQQFPHEPQAALLIRLKRKKQKVEHQNAHQSDPTSPFRGGNHEAV